METQTMDLFWEAQMASLGLISNLFSVTTEIEGREVGKINNYFEDLKEKVQRFRVYLKCLGNTPRPLDQLMLVWGYNWKRSHTNVSGCGESML